MSDNIEKKVLVNIDADLDSAKSSMATLAADAKAAADELKNLKTAMNGAKAAAADANAEYAKEKVNTQAARTEYQKKRTAILEANQAMKASKQAVQAANGSYAEAQQRLTALGKAIKNTENGFNSTNPAIQKQVAEYNKLNNQLKAFDARLGNHQRNVGNYEKALGDMSSRIGSIIPGFAQFSQVLQTAAQGFNAMKSNGAAAGEGAAAVGEGAEAGAVGVAGLVAALAILAVGLAAIIKYFADLTPNADSLAQRFAYLKGSVRAFLDDLGTGTGFKKLASDMKEVAQEAANLKMQMQDLTRALSQDAVDDAKADAKIAEIQLKMRNRRNTPEQEKAYFDQIQKISQDKYEGNIDLANKEYQLAVRTATNSKRFSAEEKRRLLQDGVEYAIILDKTKGLVNGEDDIKAIVAAQQRQIATAREREMIQERAQNRLDAVNMKGEAAAEKAKNDLLEAQRAGEEILNERKAAIAKMLQDQMEAFGRDLSMNDEHYRQLIFKQQDFIKKQEELRNKTKSPAAKRQYTKNISDAHGLIGVYGQEHAADNEKIVTEYFKKTEELVIKGQDELAQMQIANIQNVEKRELAALRQQNQTQLDAYSKERSDLEQTITRLTAERNKAHGVEKEELQHALDQQLNLLGINDDKQKALLKRYYQDRAQIIKAASDHEMEVLDEVNVLKAKSADQDGSQKHDKGLRDAEQQALLDKYNADVSQKGKTDAEKLLLEQQYLDASAAINEAYNQKQYDKIMAYTRIAQQGATDIIRSAIAHDAQAKQVALSKQKTYELNNQALTTTQKALIDEKYRKKEGQAKVKEFKDNQKMAIAQALINGALAMMKTTANTGFPLAFAFDPIVAAQTAVEIGVIAAQKPPAYATGGVHVGDGAVRGPGTGTSDSINARLSNGESVINAKSTSIFGPLLSALNVMGGGRPFSTLSPKPAFATGGVFGTYLPTSDNGMRPSMAVSSRMHQDDLTGLVNGISNAISNAPRPVVDVKDIGYQQDRLSQVVDRSNY